MDTKNKSRMPKLQTLLKELTETTRAPEQSVADQKAAVQRLADAYGLKLRKRTTKRNVIWPHEAKVVPIQPVMKNRLTRKVRHRQ